MRVLYWMDSFSRTPGGIQRLGTQAMKALGDRGFEFLVVCSSTDEALPRSEERDGIRIRRVEMFRALQERDPLAMLQARKEVANIRRDFDPQVAQVNFSGPTAMFHFDAPAPPVPTIMALHISLPEGLGGEDTLLQRLLRASDWVTANSRFVMRSAVRAVPEIEDRTSVIYNGIRTPELSPMPPPTSPPVLLGIGRLVPDKGFDVALEALSMLAQHHPRLRLRLAGEGSERQALEARARELGVSDRTDFLGWVPPERVPEVIEDATIVLVPSRWDEAFGLVVLEAALVGRPVVASRVGGLPEVVEEGRTGLLAERDDAAAFAEAVHRMLNDPERTARMGAAARERVTTRFSLERYVDEYASLYRRLGRESGGESGGAGGR